MKYVYHYDPVTHEYIGKEEADPSPREKGVFLLPANATFVCPEDTDKVAVYNPEKDEWSYFDDCRGNYYIEKDGKLHKIVIDKLGVSPPEDALAEDYVVKILEEREWRDNELFITDRYMLSDYPIGLIRRFKIKRYRKKLRNWPQSEHFPEKSMRPKLS